MRRAPRMGPGASAAQSPGHQSQLHTPLCACVHEAVHGECGVVGVRAKRVCGWGAQRNPEEEAGRVTGKGQEEGPLMLWGCGLSPEGTESSGDPTPFPLMPVATRPKGFP